MTDQKTDQGSDASRSDPDNADRAREDLKRQAEKGIEKAMKSDSMHAAGDHPEQDPAEGSREMIERDLARQEKNSLGSVGPGATDPSPGDKDK